MPVAYDGNQVLECQVTFTYDRYYFGPINSLDRRVFNSAYKPVDTGTSVGNDPVKSNDTSAEVGETYETSYESEANEWGPGGQPSASEQIALMNKNNSKDAEE